jgi:hypothetical protein
MMQLMDERIEMLIDLTATRTFQCAFVILVACVYAGLWIWCERRLAKRRKEA